MKSTPDIINIKLFFKENQSQGFFVDAVFQTCLMRNLNDFVRRITIYGVKVRQWGHENSTDRLNLLVSGMQECLF